MSATRAWLMAVLSVVAVSVAIVGRLFPLVLALDLVALWPIPALAIVLAFAVALLGGRASSRVLAPLLVVTWLILGVGWWSVGVPPSPSQAANILGPPQVPSEVALAVSLVGELTMSLDPTNVYSISVGQRGGTVGPPDVLEARQDDVMAMTVQERADGAWYRTSGWDVTLHSAALWRIEATATDVSLDLSAIPLQELDVTGNGTISLGQPVGPVPVSLRGTLVVSVPAGTAVEVIGTADVPAGWSTSDSGSASPTPGEGFIITTGGRGIQVVER